MATGTIVKLFVTDKISSETINIAGNNRGVFTIDISKTGYTPIGIIAVALSNNWMYLGGFSFNGNTATVVVHNKVAAQADDQKVTLTVLYTKS